MLVLYSFAIFASSFLLFFVQPMFARMVLPLLGGSPGVWNTAMVFYQAALLLGYLYAYAVTKWLGPKQQILVHVAMLMTATFFLPIGVPVTWRPPAEANPIPSLLMLLATAVGLPFFVISTSSPLLQKWFACSGHSYSADPYFLYSASNAGSMLALLAYPAVVEPLYTLGEQSRFWSWSFVGVMALIAVCALALWKSAATIRLGHIRQPSAVPIMPARSGELSLGRPDAVAYGISARRRLRWIGLAFVPSSLMLSVTTYITTDIASVPLFWIIPLATYLLTFILAFAPRPPIPHLLAGKAMALVLIPHVIVLITRGTDPLTIVIPLHLVAFFLVALVCHGEIAADSPPVAHLTEYYLLMSVGGVLGGAFNSLIAPLVFDGVAEYPIVLSIACLFLPWRRSDRWLSTARLLDILLPLVLTAVTLALIVTLQASGMGIGPLATALMFGGPAIFAFSFSRHPFRFALAIAGIFLAGSWYVGTTGRVLYARRSFFGVARVTVDDQGRFHQFMHGSTLHGSQWIDPVKKGEPLAYYHASGPLGQIFQALGTSPPRTIAVVGLGVGGISAYARPGQRWTYYEIDPLVEQIARDTRFFTYLQDCPANLQVVLGDGRLSLEGAAEASYDLIILDAYSSDSIPVHLLTYEALQLYLRKLSSRGVLVFHISNRYMNLEPVLYGLAGNAGLCSLVQNDAIISAADAETGKVPASFVVLARTPGNLKMLAQDRRWRPLQGSPSVGVWTSDRSSIVGIVRWRR